METKWYQKRRIYFICLIPASFFLLYLTQKVPWIAEYIFARKIYHYVSLAVNQISGLVPFSIMEAGIILIPIFLLYRFIRFLIRFCQTKANRRNLVSKAVLNCVCVGSVLFFLYSVFCGVNYNRYPVASAMQLTVRNSSAEELYAVCDFLASRANGLREQIVQADDYQGNIPTNKNYKELSKEAVWAMEKLAQQYDVLSGGYSAPKPVYFSKFMSKLGISGIYCSYTMEANVNVDVPAYTVPATMCHELSHLRGYMREDEANFIAYLACISSDNAAVQYSGVLHALVYAGNQLYEQTPDKYKQLVSVYSEGVRADLAANNTYWKQFEDDIVHTASNKINDTYLKANNQSDGVKSYGRMVDLLLAWHREMP